MDLKQFEGHTPNMLLSVNADGSFQIEDAMTEGTVLCHRNAWSHRAKESIANARIFAAAPSLLAEVKRLQDENEAMRDRLNEIEDSATYYVTQDLQEALCSPSSDPDQAMLNGLAEFCGERFLKVRVAILGYEHAGFPEVQGC